MLALRLFVPACALAYLLSIVPLRDVLRSASAIGPRVVLAALGMLFLGTVIGTIRWRVLFAACGLTCRPKFGELLRAYWIGVFYNTCVPGGVGGDVMRAIATRRIVGPGGLPTSLAIVFLDRTLGLSGMLIMIATTFSLFPLPGIPNVVLWSAFGVSVAACAVLAIVNGPRLAPILPRPLAKIAASLPRIESLPLFATALGLSVLTQLSGVVCGHLIIMAVTARPTLTDSLVMLPLVNAAQYFPLTVGGAGVREAGFVLLYGMIGVSKADALAASLVIGALSYGASAAGGILHLLRPLTLEPDAEDPAASVPPSGGAPSET
jgi:uncharacterized membrane protein YbhN (UPF0104 family)